MPRIKPNSINQYSMPCLQKIIIPNFIKFVHKIHESKKFFIRCCHLYLIHPKWKILLYINLSCNFSQPDSWISKIVDQAILVANRRSQKDRRLSIFRVFIKSMKGNTKFILKKWQNSINITCIEYTRSELFSSTCLPRKVVL